MHPLHEYVAKQLAEQLKADKVVVWYDGTGEFSPFLDEVQAPAGTETGAAAISVAGTAATLARFRGSMLEVRSVVEPHVASDDPDNVVVYVSGPSSDSDGALLKELELAGTTWQPKLRHLARNVLQQRYTAGVVDDLLKPEKLSYEDLARLVDGPSDEPPSVLKTIYHHAPAGADHLASWLADDGDDAEIADKGATDELRKLIRSRLGLDVEDMALAKLRAVTARYILGNEFRTDLSAPPPPTVEALPAAGARDDAIRKLARHLRHAHAAVYPALADRVEAELNLREASFPADALGSIDTFRFEERVLLTHCGGLVADGKYDAALAIIAAREQSFWLEQDAERRAQWQAVRLMAELGMRAVKVKAAVASMQGQVAAWISDYTADDGWHRLDLAQRRLETLVAKLDDEPADRPLGLVRRAYDDAANAMAIGFSKALIEADWSTQGVAQQTHVYPDVVATQPKPVAYFLVDAMRYEMGTELQGRFPPTVEVGLSHAVAALPSITPVGMAALLPEASRSFSVVDQKGRLGVLVDATFLADRPARGKFLAARIPTVVDLTLGDVLSLPSGKLAKQVGGAHVVIVRSQEIDDAGEGGFIHQARQTMDTVIDNIARALRRLAGAGIENAIISADHGHLFSVEKEEAMRIDKPGGAEVDLHRRCWIGRGGATPPGCVRVPAAKLGYDSDLDFVFPEGTGVFKAGGDLGFHHGGPSLQELIVPVLTVRTPSSTTAAKKPQKLTITDAPTVITNRIFTMKLQLGSANLQLLPEPKSVRPLLVSDGRQVGAAAMTVDAKLDASSGLVELEPGKVATVGFVLNDDTAPSLRIVVQDPATDAELYRSPDDLPVSLGV